MRKYVFLWILCLALIAPVSAGAGIVVVNHDEWPLSNEGFTRGDAGAFATNLADLFAEGQPGNFLAYSSNFSLRGSSLRAAMTNAGHTWTVDSSADVSLANLHQYDGIFFAGQSMDHGVLADYVNAGGNVYVAAGTTSTFGWTSSTWNGFLNTFGMEFAPGVNGVRGSVATISGDPLFDGVHRLYYDRGNYISLLAPANSNTVILEGNPGSGLIAMYKPVPVPGAIWLLGTGVGALITLRRNRG